MTLSLAPNVAKPDLAYDLLRWYVEEALGAADTPLFIDGEISPGAQQQGTFHAFLQYQDDEPNDAVTISVAPGDRELEPYVPVRETEIEVLVRAGDLEGTGAAVFV